ncbi:MAG: metal ABC transporter solute-binding protein, Zn/Mn family [Desulfuromonadales bacterium]
MMRNIFLPLLFVILTALAAQAAPLQVFVSVLPQKYIVERIGGNEVTVSVMVGPGRSPATYEPTPKQMATLATAAVYFRIGVAFETVWMERIRSNNPDLRIIDLREGITLRAIESHHHPGHDHHDEEKGQGLKDPHIWTSPLLVQVMAGKVLSVLAALNPEAEETYRRNYQALISDLESLDRDIRTKLAPLKNRRFLIFHPSMGYFADTYGLQQVPIEMEGKEPGARTLARLIDEAKAQNVRVIFVQEQFSRRLAENIARSIDATVIAIDPLAEDYATNMRHIADVFAAAMEKK